MGSLLGFVNAFDMVAAGVAVEIPSNPNNFSIPLNAAFINTSVLPIAFTEADGSISDIVGACLDCSAAGTPAIFFISDPFEGVPTGPFSATVPETGLPQDVSSLLSSDGTQFGLSLTFQSDISDPAPTIPLPTALPLFATGLGALGLLGWRRQRRQEKRSKLTKMAAAVGCALALSVGAAKAATIETFDLSGTFAGGAGGTLSGTITINVTELPGPGIPNTPPTELIPAIDVNYSGPLIPHPGPFNIVVQVIFGTQMFAEDINGNELSIIFPTPGPPPFVGAPITDGFINLCNVFGCNLAVASSLSGTITQTPIPGVGLPGLGLILAGGALLGWRRKKKAAA
jgi:LPXTG-motif cell wall-anchored protein